MPARGNPLISLRSALFLTLALLGLTSGALAQQNHSCAPLEPWLRPWREIARDPPAPGASIASRSEYERRLWGALKGVASRLYDAYFQGHWRIEYQLPLEACLGDTNTNDRLSYALHSYFFEKSLAPLQQARSEYLRDLAARIQSSDLQLFHLAGFRPGSSEGSHNAGFHRGRRFVFLDVSRIPPAEWLIHFVHVMSHQTDGKLSRAVGIYSNEGRVQRLAAWSRITDDPRALPPAVREELESWVRAGLDRGFLSEWRAWVVTFKAYAEGLNDGLWVPIQWIEEILAQRREGESVEDFCFRYLDPAFEDPHEGIFSRDLIERAVREMRQELRDQSKKR